jgi:Kef-type K+ transport system membrane component KefB/mannitol/fructose-specific phosphotransferase system IIA component (Ntr-type)
MGAEGGTGTENPVHRAMMFVIQVGIITFAARMGNILFEKIKIPGVLGELCAGILIGPYALGHISFHGFAGGLFPMPGGGEFPISPELYGLSAIAAIVLLFNVGMETNLNLLLRYVFAGGLVALGGVIASFFLGAWCVVAFSESLFGYHVGLLDPRSIFAGVASTATSVGITARILSERRKLDSPEGVTILSAAVIDDVLGIILLAIGISLAGASKTGGGIDWEHTGIVAARAVGVWLAVSAAGILASRKISFVLKWFGERMSIAIMALGLALVLSALFEQAGLAMIIGAYIMGLSLSRSDISNLVREKLSAVYAFLVPLFFCATGMLIDLGALTSSKVLIFGGVYTIVALIAKIVGCGIPALFANFNLRGAARIGVGMAPRGEVALIVAGIGLAAGILSPEIFAGVIVMVLINTVVAPPALVFLFRSSAQGTRKAPAVERAGTRVSFEFPSFEMAEFFVGKVAAMFESEGFFVHQLSRSPEIYEFRKDHSIIDVNRTGTVLVFSSRQVDVPLVNAAMYEALAAFEHAIKGMKQPLDVRLISGRLQDFGPVGPPTLSMKDYLTPDLIKPCLQGATKAEVIEELLELLRRKGLLHDVKAASQAVWQREESMSTGLQYGVAIPHGKTDAVGRLVCAVGVKTEGVQFEAMDGQPSRIFILTLSPKSIPAPHIQFMSTVSQILDRDGRNRILAGKSAEEIYAIFTAPPAPSVPTRKPLPPRFSLRDYIKPELMAPGLKGSTKTEVIYELLEILEKNGLVGDMNAAAEAVLKRESQMPTGMGDGVAIPHGRTDTVEKLVCALGTKPEGISFGSADGKPATILLLVLTPLAGADPYLQFVASVIGVLHADGRARALAASTKQELYEAIIQGSGR